MERMQRVSETDLAQETQKILRDVQRGYTAVIERQGEPEAAVIDIVDYGIMRAALHYFAEQPAIDPDMGLGAAAVHAAGSMQERYNLVVAYYLSGAISLGRAAELLKVAAIDLRNRLARLQIPLRLGPLDIDDARAEVQAALLWEPK